MSKAWHADLPALTRDALTLSLHLEYSKCGLLLDTGPEHPNTR